MFSSNSFVRGSAASTCKSVALLQQSNCNQLEEHSKFEFDEVGEDLISNGQNKWHPLNVSLKPGSLTLLHR